MAQTYHPYHPAPQARGVSELASSPFDTAASANAGDERGEEHA